MQENNEKSSLNVTDGSVSHNQPLPRGLTDPYQQQIHDINNMLQNQITRGLYDQLYLLERRALICVQAKHEALEAANRKTREVQFALNNALAEIEHLKKESAQKTELCRDFASRLLILRRKENGRKMNFGVKLAFTAEAESSTGENGNDAGVDTARSRSSKRRRL